ncbi:hypothetical protein RE6C_02142 [Rhodopirellula europaea 6C]|uniref:Uncharacterized protein n=1 Tax=Rhodopirellula europaea 6C TaxID=1263867 RepID=M2A7B7_9BACT|nr:hypothetical protein RE6C_02142 [Rhodopirellula europaea 6C]
MVRRLCPVWREEQEDTNNFRHHRLATILILSSSQQISLQAFQSSTSGRCLRNLSAHHP